MRTVRLVRELTACALAVAVAGAAPAALSDEHMPRQGMYGPGMMDGSGPYGPGYGPGMMGPGGGYGPGMMGPGYRGGCQPGMMGPGYGGGYGPGMMGPGMMGPGMMGPSMMGPGMMGPGQGYGMMPEATPGADLSADDVRARLQSSLEWHGNPRLEVGDVTEADDDTITADIVTKDGSLVQRFMVNRHTGAMQPVQ